MCIKRLVNEYVGPIERAAIDFPFCENGNPKPAVLVGENGTGKSVLVSNIVDSLYEIAGTAFHDARKAADGEGYQYYKAILPTEIHLGQEYMFSYITYETPEFPEDVLEYVFKSGTLPSEDFKAKSGIGDKNTVAWKDSENYKRAFVNKEHVETILSKDILCYFGPNRYEKPFWMGDKYFDLYEFEHPSVRKKWAGIMDNPIEVMNVTSATLQWLLDVIVDSRCDIKKTDATSYEIAHISTSNLDLYGMLINIL